MKKYLLLPLLILTGISFSQGQHPVKSVKTCLAPFYHGVASGDPLTDRVILWTRVTPENGPGPQIVEWKIAKDTSFTVAVQGGVVLTDDTRDYTVKVDPAGLDPNTTYYYQFYAQNKRSVIGRTRTAPEGDCDSLRFAVVSCANYEAGYFNVFRVLKERNDFDAILGLGDYIYEYEEGGYAPNATANRHWEPTNETITLLDYRARYSTYRLDDDLRDLHQQFPMIVIWDDHESANDSWMNGAENHQANEGSWAARKAAAKQAFFEWLPIRVTGTNDAYQIFRTLPYGDLIDLIMLDTRLHGREEQAGTTGNVVNATSRQLLGTDQFTWLGNRLSQSTSQWKIIGQQVMMAPLTVLGVAINGDQWDGYPAERNRVFNHISTYGINNVVVLTGDIHSSWANDLPGPGYNSNGSGSVGVEYVTPSVTSPGINIPGGASAIMASNSHIKYAELSSHGFVILDVNKVRCQGDWYYVNTLDNPSSQFAYAQSFKTNDLSNHLSSANAAALPRTNIQGFQTLNCPYYPVADTTSSTAGLDNVDKPVILGLYPNPVTDLCYLNISCPFPDDIRIYVLDEQGKQVLTDIIPNFSPGTRQVTLDVTKLTPGKYVLQILNGGHVGVHRFIKL